MSRTPAELLVVINRPETPRPRWNLAARQISGPVAMRMPHDPERYAEHSPGVLKQDVALAALSDGVSGPPFVAARAQQTYGVELRAAEVEPVIDAAIARYGAKTAYHALSFAVCDGSVSINEQSYCHVDPQTKRAIRQLAHGMSPHEAMAEGLRRPSLKAEDAAEAWSNACYKFGVQSRYALLRCGFERGFVPRIAFIPGRKTTPVTAPKLPCTAPARIAFSLPPHSPEAGQKPERSFNRTAARWRAAGQTYVALGRTMGVGPHSIAQYLDPQHKKYDAASAPELSAKMRVLGLAGGEQAVKMSPSDDLTPRELSIATGIAQGYTNKKIGRVLFVEESTIAAHCRSMYAKLGVEDRLGVVACLFEAGVFVTEPHSR
ncbi:MAG TPA: helix-turn-helix transcriptional regulator [Candidatus Saccharimonadales bacterium]|nr:helix-turn-helix transcriptional regulator [Candidatus Saccharimonadales bacterium]